MSSNHLIIGTAGHIDHGKTALVKALTGTDTDRLKEEKKRGITIELGFAYTELTNGQSISFIDVPGHEGFIKNMLAGIGGIDIAMLVVAADESVMPQTEEHFNICRLMGIKEGIIVITKTSLAEDLVEMVEMEIEELVKGSFLDGAPLFKVDSLEGRGIDVLKEKLAEITSRLAGRKADGAYLLHMDRVFTMKGFGTVVTGTTYRGKATRGQFLEVLPVRKEVKIRTIQVHDRVVEETTAGQRTALNLQDVDLDDIKRGMTLAEPGIYKAGTVVDAVLEVLDNSPMSLANNDRVRFHHGALETFGRLRILSGKTIEKGKRGVVQIKLESPVTAICGDRFILRRYSPATTVAGGTIVDNLPQRGGKFTDKAVKMLLDLPSSNIEKQLEYFCYRAGKKGVSLEDIMARIGVSAEKAREMVSAFKGLVLLGENPKALFSWKAVKELQFLISDYLKEYHRKFPLKQGLSKKEIKNALYAFGQDRVFDHILSLMKEEGTIKSRKEDISLSSHKILLSDDEERLKKELSSVFQSAGLEPPASDEVVQKKGRKAQNMINLLLREGILVRLDNNLVFHLKSLEKLKKDILALGTSKEVISISDFKNLTGLSRKFSIPLLEYLDREKITIRVEGGRKIRSSKQ